MPTRALALLMLLLAFTLRVALAEEPARTNEGTIVTIEIYQASESSPVNAGTVIGGIAGGALGHQIGSGRGNTAATIGGALGGAVIGNQIEKKRTSVTRYRVTVRLDSGGTLAVNDVRDGNLRVGDRVRVDGTHVDRI